MQESDWDLYLHKLVEQTKIAIEKFYRKHGDEEVCYFAYDSEPCYGYVLTCFNTSKESLKYIKNYRAHHVSYRQQLQADPDGFNNAYYQTKANTILPFCNNTGDFAYQGFTEINFPEWEDFFQNPNYPESEKSEEDYLTNRVARLFSRSIDQLVKENAFEKLRLAQPTLLGFTFHDDSPIILEILNLSHTA